MGTTRSMWAGFELEHDPRATTADVAALPGDVVLPPSQTTSTAARLMIRTRVRRALDLGTGCGALALFASRIADDVVATDVNPRALDFTRRNAARNSIDNVRTVAGSFAEPVRDERFGLVVGNLPFVISPPGSGLVFRDGQRPEGDLRDDRRVCERAIDEAAGVLAPGGVAQFLVNWIVREPGGRYDEPIRWVAATGCDALVLLHSVHAPIDYVRRWAIGGDDNPDEWRSYLRGLGAIGVANGSITIRRALDDRPDRAPTIRTVRMTTPPRGNGGRQLARILDAQPPSTADLLTTPRIGVVPHRLDDAAAAGLRRFVADDTCGVAVDVRAPVGEIVSRLAHDGSIDAACAAWCAGNAGGMRSRHDLTEATVDAVRRLVVGGLAVVDPSPSVDRSAG